MKKSFLVFAFAISLIQTHVVWADIENLPESVSGAQVSDLLKTPTADEAEEAILRADEQGANGENLSNVLLSREQIKQAKQAIKKLTITDFIYQKYESSQAPDIVGLEAEPYNGTSFPKLNTYYTQNTLQFSRLLFDDFAKQAKSLPFPAQPKPQDEIAGGWEPNKLSLMPKIGITSSWDTGAWPIDGDNAIKNPDLDELSNLPKVWAGPVVNDNVVRYHKKNNKTIARVYFNGEGSGYSRFQPFMQGIWAFARLHHIDISVSLEQNANQYALAFPLLFNLRMPIHIVTPDGLVPATLITARLNDKGECNTGNWIELELASEKPIAMWAFLALPTPELAKSAKISRQNYEADKANPDSEYMVGLRKVLVVDWKENVLPELKIIATRYDYNSEEYNEKGEITKRHTLDSTWGSEVFSDSHVEGSIHEGEFGDCATK